MVLIEKALEIDEESFVTGLEIRESSPFCDGRAVPAWVGIEYMAQSIAAYAGAEALARGEKVHVGFLLGTREYRPRLEEFSVGSALRVHVKKVIHDPGGLSVLECQIRIEGEAEPVVSSNLTVFEVRDLDAFLKEHAQ